MNGLPCSRCGAPISLLRTLCHAGDLRCRACGLKSSALHRPSHFLWFYGLYGLGIFACIALLIPRLGPYLAPLWIISICAILPMVALAIGCTALTAARAQQHIGAPAKEPRLPVKVMWHLLGVALTLSIVIGSLRLWAAISTTDGSSANLPPPTAATGQTLDRLSAEELSWQCTNVAGDALVLGELTDDVLFYNVWATWCPPCVAELPSIAALRDALPADKVRFLLVSTESAETVREFAKTRNLDLPFASAETLPEALRTQSIPATFVLQGDRVLYRHVGGANWNHPPFRDWLRSIQR